jgi:hypothetical protein
MVNITNSLSFHATHEGAVYKSTSALDVNDGHDDDDDADIDRTTGVQE